MATSTSKARKIDARPAKPSVARTEIVDKATRARFEEELDGALKRKPASEVKLGGALRAVGALSPALRGTLAEAAALLVKRGSFTRELYTSSIRTLSETSDKSATAILKTALAADDAGGNATLSAACFSRDPALAAPLAKLAASRQSHLAFGAETARVCRRESNGAHLTSIAPMIKESHRISICTDLFVPLTRGEPIPVFVGPALAVLRGAERHLGRWLVLADVATKAGDNGPLEEATQKASVGPTSARLSDRPSADRDTTFLFRMAHARAPSCKPMLEGLVKGAPLADEVAVRAASYLARDHGRDDLRAAIIECATDGKREELRGLAVAALWDSAAGPDRAEIRAKARDLSDELTTGRAISSVAWGALVRAAHATHREADFVVTTETALRWIQWGWLE